MYIHLNPKNLKKIESSVFFCYFIDTSVYVLPSTIRSCVSKSWGGGVTTLDIDKSGPRLCCWFLQYFPISLPYLFQLCSGSFSPYPRAYLLSPPQLLPSDAAYLSLFTHLSPPILPGPGVTVHLDNFLARQPAATARLCFPPLPAEPKESLTLACACLPPSGCPPLPPLTCVQVSFRPRVVLSGGPFLPLPSFLNMTPSPLSVKASTVVLVLFHLKRWYHVLLPPSPVHSPRLPRFLPHHLLVSSEVLMFDLASFWVSARGPGASTP